jgi:protein-tyrosine phosphatase
MIDLHSHVLPGLDDGSPSLEESVAMLHLAAQTGVTDLVASPHANPAFRFDPETVERQLDELREFAPPGLRLHYGCDFHLSFDNIQDALAHPARYTIDHGPYLLVEFSDLLIPKTTDEVFTRMLGAGMIPIVTHPERNPLLWRRLDQIARWTSAGCRMQITAQSFLGRFGKEARDVARRLVELGLAHVVASDAHDSQDRPPRLDLAYRHVSKRWGEPVAQRLFLENPRSVLSGEKTPEAPPAKARTWRRFWTLSRT